LIAIDLGTIEYYDSDSNQFVYEKGGVVRFEYTLKIVYDWEAKWRKPFLKGGLTEKETVDFYKMMALDQIDEKFLTNEVMMVLSKYIADDSTATTFSNLEDGQNGGTINKQGKYYSSEEIYALMFQANIPIEFENRNLNRLLVMLKIVSTYNSPPKKMSQQDIYKQNSRINAQRRAMLNSKG
jgi:hypothetical protein